MNNYQSNGQSNQAETLLAAKASDLNEKLIKAKTKKNLNEKSSVAIEILRSFILSNNYKAAEDFVASVKKLPESASNNDWARWYYYLGRIEAIKGLGVNNYKNALNYFEFALRKAPQNGAIGFKQELNKWIVLVKLLVGEIPDRSLFRTKELHDVLMPYLRLSQAVRLGDVAGFMKIKEEFESRFEKDKTTTIVERIHQSVIRTAIRQISLTYSRIFIRDVAVKLQSSSVEDAHDTVMKSINEGILKAEIITNDKEFGGQPYVKFGESNGQYRGTEPQREFDKRINELLKLYNHAIKALRYPDNRNPEIETIEQQRKREQEALELAAAEEEDDDMLE